MNYKLVEQNGRHYRLVPQKAWERLLTHIEELEDIRDLKKAIENPEESFPGDVVNRILDGENEIKVFRQYRHFTQQDLADRAGISRNYLSLLESKKRSGTKKVLAAIAKELAVSIDDLF